MNLCIFFNFSQHLGRTSGGKKKCCRQGKTEKTSGCCKLHTLRIWNNKSNELGILKKRATKNKNEDGRKHMYKRICRYENHHILIPYTGCSSKDRCDRYLRK